MDGDLFNGQLEEYVLFNSTNGRILLRQNMNQFTADYSNGWYKESLCGHLKWIKASELKVKTYTVKR